MLNIAATHLRRVDSSTTALWTRLFPTAGCMVILYFYYFFFFFFFRNIYFITNSVDSVVFIYKQCRH